MGHHRAGGQCDPSSRTFQNGGRPPSHGTRRKFAGHERSPPCGYHPAQTKRESLSSPSSQLNCSGRRSSLSPCGRVNGVRRQLSGNELAKCPATDGPRQGVVEKHHQAFPTCGTMRHVHAHLLNRFSPTLLRAGLVKWSGLWESNPTLAAWKAVTSHRRSPRMLPGRSCLPRVDPVSLIAVARLTAHPALPARPLRPPEAAAPLLFRGLPDHFAHRAKHRLLQRHPVPPACTVIHQSTYLSAVSSWGRAKPPTNTLSFPALQLASTNAFARDK